MYIIFKWNIINSIIYKLKIEPSMEEINKEEILQN